MIGQRAHEMICDWLAGASAGASADMQAFSGIARSGHAADIGNAIAGACSGRFSGVR